VGEKKKIGVFKLNWIAQRNLEIDVHEMHNNRRKGAAKEAVDMP